MTRAANTEAQRVRAELDRMTERLAFVRTHLPAVVARLTEATGPGVPSTGAGGRTGASGSPVEREALAAIDQPARHDPAATDIRRIERLLADAHDHVFHLERAVAPYVRATPAPETRPCEKCGSDTDRPRRGLCPRCHTAWLRAGKPVAVPLRHTP